MCSGSTKTAVVTSPIGIDIGKNHLARRHRAAAGGATSQLGLKVGMCRGGLVLARTTFVGSCRALVVAWSGADFRTKFPDRSSRMCTFPLTFRTSNSAERELSVSRCERPETWVTNRT